MNQTPLLQRGGSIIVLQDSQLLNMWICPDRACTFTLYEDDGISNDYQEGIFSSTKFTATKSGNLVTIIAEQTGSYVPTEKIIYHIQCTDPAPFEIYWNNVKLQQFLDVDRFKNAEAGWHYHHSTKTCTVKCGTGRNLKKMVVNFGKFDLIRMDYEN